MMWRLLMRRCPSGSFTIVGDVAQTGSAAGASSWREVLQPQVGDRWRLSELTVNYRTPQQVMDLAASVLAAGGSTVQAPRSARIGRYVPAFIRVDDGNIGSSAALADLALAEWQFVQREGGTVAVITPTALHSGAAATICGALPEGLVATDTESLIGSTTARVSVLTVDAAKGLEFDSVVVLEPAAIVAQSPQGRNDLYVALTRPTQRLHVLHGEELPSGLSAPGGSTKQSIA